MADESELQELRQRLGGLPLDEQLRLFELVLGDYRRKREEEHAELRAMHQAAIQELLEMERRQAGGTAGAKRAAG